MKNLIEIVLENDTKLLLINVFGSSSPTGMVILPLGIYKTILKKFFIKSKKALKNQGFLQGIFFVTLLWLPQLDSNQRHFG